MSGVDWRLAACRDYERDLFYADGEADQEKARAVCSRCPIIMECRQYALEVKEDFGVWGGLTAKERRAARVKKNRVHCPGCGGVDVSEDILMAPGTEICRGCGLSWRV